MAARVEEHAPRLTGCSSGRVAPSSTHSLDAGWDGTLTELAVRSGWYDQAHFTRDFSALVGVTPGRYRERAAAAGRDSPASSVR